MNCKISCSFGEIVDKVTILKIKQKNTKSNESLFNIKKELSIILDENPEVCKSDKLFSKLSEINNKLWELEDLIREKSRKKEFDVDYIRCAEEIHITNDERYNIKRKINDKYNSNLKEEKIYNKELEINNADLLNLEKGKYLYTNGNFKESLEIIEEVMIKYEKYRYYDSFCIDLLFSYSNICSIFNKKVKYFDKIKDIMNQLNTLEVNEEQKIFCRNIYGMICLSQQNYKESYPYLNEINYITGPNVNSNNMSFFNSNDINKTLLIYDGGGIGDKLMLFRLINDLCLNYKNNFITFFVNDNLIWLLEGINKYENLKFVGYNETSKIGYYDYHCNLLSLIKYLNYEYDSIKFNPLLKDFKIKTSEIANEIIKEIDKKTYVINWKGNVLNPHEKNNRSMDLKYAIPLFEERDINWIVITKDITKKEEILLNKYNVKYYGEIIDNEKSFYDSISILRNVKGIISTDTSLVHLSANLDIPTYVLLTLGCEWRWTHNDYTKWYPNLKLFRQKELGNWSDVVKDFKNYLNNLFNI